MDRTISLACAAAVSVALGAAPPAVFGQEAASVQEAAVVQEAPASRQVAAVEEPVSLERALSLARARNADLRMARARADAAASGSDVARSALLPNLELRAGWLRTDDPVAAFGTRLRQRRFGAEDLALDALNRPAPVEDWTGTLSLGWRPLDPASWSRRAAAERGAEAAALAAARTREATDYRTRVLYVQAAAAASGLDAALAAREAATATLDRFRRRHEEGLLTRADLLQGRAELEAARADLEEARRARREARLTLGLHLGWGRDTVPVITDSLEAPGELPTVPTAVELGRREDLRALDARVAAAEARLRSARSEFLPSAHLFGELGRHAVEPLGAGGTVWSAGVGVELPLFAGGRRLAEAGRARAELRSAREALDLARREAGAEVVRARDAVSAASRAVEASTAAREAAGEGRDLMRRRFQEGLASAADLLAAEARASRMRSRQVEALAQYRMARARLEFVTGSRSEERER